MFLWKNKKNYPLIITKYPLEETCSIKLLDLNHSDYHCPLEKKYCCSEYSYLDYPTFNFFVNKD